MFKQDLLPKFESICPVPEDDKLKAKFNFFYKPYCFEINTKCGMDFNAEDY